MAKGPNVRAPAGTRIEETERVFGQVEDVIREVVPESERISCVSASSA